MDLEKLFKEAEQHRGLEKLDEAVQLYSEIVNNSDEDSFYKAESLHMIGLIYYQQEKYELSQQYLRDAEECFQRLDDDEMKAAVLRDQAMVAKKEENLDKARGLLLQSVQLLKNRERKGHLGISKVKLGEIYQQEGNFAEAEKEILEGIGEIKDSDDKFFESSAYFSLAKLQRERGLMDEAKLAASRALEILEKISPDKQHAKRKEQIREFIDGLS